MRANRFGTLAFAVLLFIAPAGALAAEPPRSGHPVFDRAVELVTEHFYDASALDQFAAAVQREVEDPETPLNADSSEARVDSDIDAILASLEVSHTGRFKPDTIDYFEMIDIFRFAVRDHMRRLFPPEGEANYAGIGMVAKEERGRWFVTHVYDGLQADRAGVLVGDEILSLDGGVYHGIESFRGKIGETVEIRLRRQEGAEPITVSVAVERLRPLRSLGEAIENSMTVMERDGRHIGYVRLWTLSSREGMRSLARGLAFGPLKDADGLVVDLRGRWGGGEADAAEILVGNTPSFRLIPREGEPVPANVRWDRPVVGIIDEGSRSGLELFAYALKANGIPLVGTQTAGAMLAGRAFLLPDDSLLEVAVSDAVIGEDERLEGRGIEPDIPVSFSLPYAAGADPQLDAAVDEMQGILAGG